MSLLRKERPVGGAIGVMLLCVGLSVIYAAQVRLDRLQLERPPMKEFRYLPKGEYLKVAVLGYDQLAADLLWLNSIQVMGEKKIAELDPEWLYGMLDIITTLDPQFDYVYLLGGIYLSVMVPRTDLANRLLAKGMVNVPTKWQMPFFYGFNEFYYLGHFKEAADAMARAAALPGRPDYVPFLASRLYANAREPEVALEFLDRMYRLNSDEDVRARLLTRIKELTIERDITIMSGAVQRYHDRYGRYPAALTDLVAAGGLNGLPDEPFGGRYVYDAASGTITSSTHPERLRVLLPESRLGAPEQHPTRRVR